ncbi:MAG: hypothetical protein ABIH00_06180 [Armatimonadota bacterium]
MSDFIGKIGLSGVSSIGDIGSSSAGKTDSRGREELISGLEDVKQGLYSKKEDSSFKRVSNYHGALNGDMPPDDELKKLMKSASVLVVDATSDYVTAEGIKRAMDAAKGMGKNNFKVQGYVSSSGVARSQEAKDPVNPQNIKELSEQERQFAEFIKDNEEFKELYYLDKEGKVNREKRERIFTPPLQGEDKICALRVDVSDSLVYKVWSGFLKGQIAGSYKKGVKGVFIDDADNLYLINRQKADNIDSVKKYERGMNNHINIIGDMIKYAKGNDQDSAVTINRGFDMGKGLEDNQWHVGLDPDKYVDNNGTYCSSPDAKTRQTIKDIYKNTDSVMFESVHTEYDLKIFSDYLVNLYNTNPDIKIQWVVYQNKFGSKTMDEVLDIARNDVEKLKNSLSDPKIKDFISGNVHIKAYPSDVLWRVDTVAGGRVADL